MTETGEAATDSATPAIPRITILTGATGALGREILRTVLDRSEDERVLATVRSSPTRTAAARLAELLEALYPDEARWRNAVERVDPIDVDLSRETLNLTAYQRALVSGRPCRIIHGAGAAPLDPTFEEARAVNLGSTQRMLDVAVALAEKGSLERFAYVSSAYVAGLRRGPVFEDELDAGQRFHNTYEKSKLEAEALVRLYRKRLPVSIFRPSIVAGHSSGDVDPGLRAAYGPVKAFTRGFAWCIPGDRRALFDLVPVDFVARALLHILERSDSVGDCFHLTSGRPITLERAVQLGAEFFGVRPAPIYLPPGIFYPLVQPLLHLALWGRWREVLTASKVVMPYLTSRLEFDNTHAAKALTGSGLAVPDTETHLKTVFGTFKESAWGRELLSAAR